MMARKWFELVSEDGKALTSAAAVSVDVEDVDAVRDAVKDKFKDSHLAGIAPTDLIVFANRTAYGAKQKLPKSSSPVTQLGKDEYSPLVVCVPQRTQVDSRYFILPEVQEKVEKAVFVIVQKDKDHKGVGMCVFFSLSLAVTCDHNLTDEQTVGSLVLLALKEEMANVEVVVRNPDLDFAILKSANPRSFIPPWNRSPDQLKGRYDLVLASFRLRIDEYQEEFKNELEFTPASCISLSWHRRHPMYYWPTYTGDSGAALIIKDGFLAGIHQQRINALHEELDRKKVIKHRLNDVEESLGEIVRNGVAQACSGLLVHEFKNVVTE